MLKRLSLTWLDISAIALLSAGLIWITISQISPDQTTAGRIPAPAAGFLAPELVLTDMQSQSVDLIDLRGKAVIVNFWASWCPPCRQEMPALQTIHETYPDDLVILAVNATQQDSISDINRFLWQIDLTFPILLDNQGTAMSTYQVRSLPTTFFIRPDGVINDVVVGGPISKAYLQSQVDTLLSFEAP